MSLHFLLKAEARSLSVVQVLATSDDEALALFRQLRWGEGEQVASPHCGRAHRHYFRPTRKIWRCAGCQDDFSVTSGTIFAFHKLPLRLYLAAAILFTNAVKGISALQVGRDLAYRTRRPTFSCKEIRESLLVGRDECALSGEVHVDGAYVGGKVRPGDRIATGCTIPACPPDPLLGAAALLGIGLSMGPSPLLRGEWGWRVAGQVDRSSRSP